MADSTKDTEWFLKTLAERLAARTVFATVCHDLSLSEAHSYLMGWIHDSTQEGTLGIEAFQTEAMRQEATRAARALPSAPYTTRVSATIRAVKKMEYFFGLNTLEHLEIIHRFVTDEEFQKEMYQVYRDQVLPKVAEKAPEGATSVKRLLEVMMQERTELQAILTRFEEKRKS